MEQPILIQGAMACELEFLQKKLEKSREVNVGPNSFWQGSFNNTPVVLSRLQIGFAQTAAATALAIENFEPKFIINQGTAGAYTPELNNYDIVVGERYFNAGAVFTGGHTEAQHEDLLPWQYLALDRVEAATSLKNCVSNRPFYHYSDIELVKLVMEEAEKYTKGHIVTGTVASAEQWNCSPNFLQQLHHITGADCEEMEAAAAGRVAAAWKVPFICLKVISNNNVTGKNFDANTAVALQEFIWGLF